MSLFSDMMNYVRSGAPVAFGIDPVGITDGGNTIWDLGGEHMAFENGKLGKVGEAPASGWGKYASRGMIGLASVGTLYNLYSGYQEDGFSGMYDAGVWEIATASAANRFAYGAAGSSGPAAGPNTGILTRLKNTGIKPAGSVVKFGGGAGMAAGIARSVGAGIGASIGQQVAGTPGAFVGAFIGAAPVRFAATHPLLAAGAIAGAGAAAVGYGAYQVVTAGLRAGASHRRRQRSIDTSGSMAAFMTSGAHTMRGRAVQAIARSHTNARSALGQEATFMSRPRVNYHSRYR